MAAHDPRKVLESLRNHLTQPEANIAFLLGAGTSCAVRIPVTTIGAAEQQQGEPKTRSLIPNVAELTEICVKEIRKLDPDGEAKRFGLAYDAIEKEIKPPHRAANIEDILSCVRRKLHAIGATDTLSGLSSDDLGRLEKVIRATIAAQVNPDPTSFPAKLPHEDFVRWIARMPRSQPIEIFTTNYDILVETALEAERVPAFDGFVGCNRPFFSHDSLTRPESAPGPAWTRLWKIHGSINWRLDTIGGRQRVVRTEPHNEGEMILPSHHKYDESRKQPYTALLDRLTRVLERDDAILFVCGYSFSDDHINAIIFDALEAKRRPHVVAMQYAEVEAGSVLADRASRYLNLMALGPRTAHIGGRHGGWRLGELRGASHIARAFDLDAAPEGEQPTGDGTFRLGDFARFAEFLGALTRPD
ncbi:SIR2 family protein [Bradyrhizobium sp. WYCCWR 12699]|uniref:SIR2 family NAD-dependent protein deacylase n=1 Tax=Bradyrhizobium sp. WYCCWR 12699 TaxID=3064203 RepID=UPI0028A55A76|nr:SIR2 family protein [Bradyrhizobium sp. WYCCWR 12699]MDT4737251.1 SIR2 family protein [Bradyrhizobium sp. WYCCWR 12699]